MNNDKIKEASSTYYNKITKEKIDEILLEISNKSLHGSKPKYDITKDGYVGNGLYCLGGLAYTGKRGWDQFNKALLDEVKGPRFKIELKDDYYNDKMFYMEDIKNKYYIPTIEEFHVGFEFEQTSAYREMDGSDDVYRNHTMTIDPEYRYSQWQDIIGALKYDLIRVKRLDKDDIINLGFKLIEKESYEYIKEDRLLFQYNYEKDTLILTYINWYNTAGEEYRVVKIVDNADYLDHDEEFGDVSRVVFSGVIKNKSELSKLLKQLKA